MFRQQLYRVVTLFECMQNPATVAWLIQSDVSLPEDILPGRYPAPAEIRKVIDAIPGIRADFLISSSVWQVTVISRADVAWASLAVKDYSGDPEAPHHFCFTAGWDEIVLLLTSHLSKYCGPLVLMHDSGALPQLVS